MFTYQEVKRIMQFSTLFTDLYARYERMWRGTVFETLYNKLGNIDYTLNSGVLDDDTVFEYKTAIGTLNDLKTAIEDILKSEEKLADAYIYDLMIEAYTILTTKSLI